MAKEGSGVYCALTVCLDSLNNEGYVDVFQTVRSLREQRPYILYSKVWYSDIVSAIVIPLSIWPTSHRNCTSLYIFALWSFYNLTKTVKAT